MTGVSTGIGLATTKLLLQEGFRVFGSVRKGTDASRLRAELGDGFTPLIFDVTDEAAIADAVPQVERRDSCVATCWRGRKSVKFYVNTEDCSELSYFAFQQTSHIDTKKECSVQVKKALEGKTLFGLVNNAGIANHACLMHQPIAEFRKVMNMNLIGPLCVTQVSLSSLHVSLLSICKQNGPDSRY